MFKKFFGDLKKYYKYTVYSAKSELRSEVASSYLNWLWWILDPFLFMMVYSFISVVVFGKGEEHFPIFVFIGLSVWTFFNKSVLGSVRVVKNNRAIVTKVYIPKFVLIMQKLFVQGFKMIVSFGIVIIMMIVYRVNISPKIFFFIPIMVNLFLITFGISMIMLHFGVLIDDLFNVMTVGLRLLFYMSGVFYALETRVPAPYGDLLLKLNPMASVMQDLRNVLLYNKMPDLHLMVIWFVLGIILSMIGICVVYKYENSYAKVI